MIGERIKELRVSEGMTQHDLAEKLQISTSAVGMYEQNRRKLPNDIIIKLCEIFNISSDWLLSGNEAPLRQRSIYRCANTNEELNGVLDDLKERLIGQDGLMFNGRILDNEDIETIFDAMRLGAEIAASRSVDRKKNYNDESRERG